MSKDNAVTPRKRLQVQQGEIQQKDAESAAMQNDDRKWQLNQQSWQLVTLVIVWLYLWTLQLDNDGLWFRGDSTRHAMNGFFWLDYLRDFTWDAKGYALSYYARYPAIDPASRPPLFYLLEGLAFAFFGPSPYVAKGLVLCFSLVAAVYLWAWLRRWISEEAAWAAPLFLLLPGISCWSHAIMLNIPALTVSFAALYYTRSWIDTPNASIRDFWLVPALTLSAILTYYTAGIIIFAIAGCVMFHRGLGRPLRSKELALLIFALIGLLPFAWIILHWAPMHVRWGILNPMNLLRLSSWLFYPAQALQLCNMHLLVLAGVGAMSYVWNQRWRNEVFSFVIWILSFYVPLSLLEAKDLRYALLLSAPLVGLGAIAVVQASACLANSLPRLRLTSQSIAMVTFLMLLLLQVYLASSYRVTSVSGYKEVATFMAEVAPAEPVFFDGFNDGNFTFYIRAGDPNFHRRVVLGNKLLYTFSFFPGWQQQDFVHSPEEVIEVLRQRGGCHWLVVEMGEDTNQLAPMRYLRQAVKTDAFEFVRSFPIQANKTTHVDVYRFKLPILEVDEVELPFAVLGSDVKYRVRPIPSRSSRTMSVLPNR